MKDQHMKSMANFGAAEKKLVLTLVRQRQNLA